MRQAFTVLLLGASLIGCATPPAVDSPWLVEREQVGPGRCDPLGADIELGLSVAQEMASTGRRHAALANLEQLPSDIPQVRLSKARLLRILGHGAEAERLYRSLSGSCVSAQASHGLGQLAASRGDLLQAQQHLRAAASWSPASEYIRNDLGVVYMKQRRLAEAQFELLTAMELNQSSPRPVLNLLALLLYQGNTPAADELIRARGLSESDIKRAEQRVSAMRREDGVASVTTVPSQPLATPDPVGTAEVVRAAGLPDVRPVESRPVPLRAHAERMPPASAVEQSSEQSGVSRSTRMPLAEAAQRWTIDSDASSGSSSTQPGLQRGETTDGRRVMCRAEESADGRAVLKCIPE